MSSKFIQIEQFSLQRKNIMDEVKYFFQENFDYQKGVFKLLRNKNSERNKVFYNLFGTEFLTLIDGVAYINDKKINYGDIIRVDEGELFTLKTEGETRILSYTYGAPIKEIKRNFSYPEKIKKEKTLISIIIIAKDIEHHICKCINSCINQTYKNIEIIVVDDNSSDNTLKKIKSMAIFDKRIRVYSCNLGMNGVRKFGLQKMRGDYCLFIDGDDWINNDTIECLIKIATQHNSECIIFGFNHYNDKSQVFSNEVYPTSICASSPPLWWEKTNLSAMQTSQINHTVWMVFFSKSLKTVAESALIHIYQYEDLPFLITLLQYAKNPTMCNHILHHYRRDRTGQSTQNWSAILPAQKQECLHIAVKHALSFIKADNWFFLALLLYKIENIYKVEMDICRSLKDNLGQLSWQKKWKDIVRMFPFSLSNKILNSRTKTNFLNAWKR